MSDRIRLTARLNGRLTEPKVKHYVGWPPMLSEGKGRREQLDFPALLSIEEEPDGVFLFRFTEEGRLVGDTWHMTVEEAKQQARYEYGELLCAWIPIPPEVNDKDLVSFGLNSDDITTV
jgi:hypothetical protein